MLSNKYQSSTNLDYTRPHKRYLPGQPDLSNFSTNSDELAKLTNFGLEMMKFLPKFEQLAYAGRNTPLRLDEPHANLQYKSLESDEIVDWAVTQEWLEAFKLYPDGDYDNQDYAYEYGLQYDDENLWPSGMVHRQGAFGGFANRGSFAAGSGVGSNYKNLDFKAEANEWNHIRQKTKSKGANSGDTLPDNTAYTGTMEAVGNSLTYTDHGPYTADGEPPTNDNPLTQVNPYIEDLDQLISWQEVVNFTRDFTYNGEHQSYYDIVMSGSYTSITDSADAMKLLIAMYESRARAWEAMRVMFGPVMDTHDDGKMMTATDKFLSRVNENTNSHALGIAPFFLEIQHSFLNRLFSYYKGPAAEGMWGYDVSSRDRAEFTSFNQWSWEKYERYMDENIEDTYQGAMGYFMRAWGNDARDETSAPSVPKSISSDTMNGNRFGWDRKYFYVGSMSTDTNENDINDFTDSHSDPGDEPYMGAPLPSDDGIHAGYTSAQFLGLNDVGVMGGERFKNNWVVHAYGMYLKNGIALDRVKVMSRIELSRSYSQEFKKDTGDFRDRKEEIGIQKAQEEAAAMKGQAKRLAEQKRRPDAIRVGSKSKAGNNNDRNSPPPSPRRSGGNNNNRFAGMGTKAEFKKALQGFANRFLGHSAKNKAMLAKIKKDTA